MDLLRYHGKRIAVLWDYGGVQHVFSGRATLKYDLNLGLILRIPLQEQGRDLPGNPALILQENSPADGLVVDDLYGCDFRIDLTPARDSRGGAA